MKNTTLLLLCSLMFIPFLSSAQLDEYRGVIVKVKAGEKNLLHIFKSQNFKEISEQLQISKRTSLGNETTFLLQYDNLSIAIEEALSMLESTGNFEFVEPDHIGYDAGVSSIVPNDPLFDQGWQWNMLNTGTVLTGGGNTAQSKVDADIDMDLAWEIETGSESIIIAILDGGSRVDHPEFEGRIWTNPEETENGEDSDNNGYVDDVYGWDFVDDDNDPSDERGHGMNVTGILGATGDNNIGIAGVNWKSKLMTCRVSDDEGRARYSSWISAINYAVDHGAHVINMSQGGSTESEALEEAVQYAYDNDVLISVSMMNTDDNTIHYPAFYDEVIAVGATDWNDERSSPFSWGGGSCYGDHIDICAPGSSIRGLTPNIPEDYGLIWSGTSQAAPLVTGVASLLLSMDPTLTPDELKEIMQSTAEDEVGDPDEDTPGWDEYHGHGRLNAFDALNSLVISSVADLSTESEMVLYPNPGASTMYIIPAMDYNWEILNLQNSTVSRGQGAKLDVSALSSGVYLIKINNKTVKKIIVQ